MQSLPIMQIILTKLLNNYLKNLIKLFLEKGKLILFGIKIFFFKYSLIRFKELKMSLSVIFSLLFSIKKFGTIIFLEALSIKYFFHFL